MRVFVYDEARKGKMHFGANFAIEVGIREGEMRDEYPKGGIRE